ncbi:ABC transporter D family member 2, chloroplastic isoform X3 [Durio zibethinus]|uniref:ABC transporter D family member 2, chloroplastic isoform X3 n=1 Tax=Durio zibethinus TaxID=66656 RepID=A0A6P6BJ23_DURZI|nr:ABC transporter D family member 2, chloroplastic isoform X3 [Durio zibethinus]
MIAAQAVLYSYPYLHRQLKNSCSSSSHGHHHRHPLFFISRRLKRRNSNSWNIASTSQSQLPTPPYNDEGQQRKVSDLNMLFHRFWKVAAPYWFSDDKVEARLQLTAVFALTLATTGISVGFNFLGRDFYNALANKDEEQFTKQLLYYVCGFAGGIPGLVTLNFLQEKKEADFRYGLVRVRENAESIAFYGGEDSELQLLLQRFTSAFENLTQLLISSRNLEFFTNGYRYLIQILPAAVVAPMYFSGKIEFGVINQSVSAFNHILGDISLIVYQFQAISAFSAAIDRLGEFDDVLDISRSKCLSDPMEHINLTYSFKKGSQVLDCNGSIPVNTSLRLLDVENLSLKTPKNNSTLVRDLSFAINEKDHLLVIGPSGSGKTSLLRALAGLWTTGKGKVTFYVENGGDAQSLTSSDMALVDVNSADMNEFGRPINGNSRSVFFLPQRPYMVLGTLRQQLLYPTWAGEAVVSDDTKFGGSLSFLTRPPNFENVGENRGVPIPTTDDLMQVLEDVRLGYILSRFRGLDSVYEWSSVLSLGEQQRLAFARMLLSKPKLALLDESTSALDEVNEAHLYEKTNAAGITYISIGHRRTLYAYHCRVLKISSADADSKQRNWNIESIDHDNLHNFLNL